MPAFVAAFLYYTALTLAVLGSVDFSPPVIATAYLAWPVIYLALVLGRAGQLLAHIQVPIAGDTRLVLH